jgi:hypothetical protein
MGTIKHGLFTLDFQCEETGYSVSTFAVKAVDSIQAEKSAREMLHPQFTWICSGIDRVRDAN